VTLGSSVISSVYQPITLELTEKWDEDGHSAKRETMRMKKQTQELIVEGPSSSSRSR
jgi:hypothetical protein